MSRMLVAILDLIVDPPIIQTIAYWGKLVRVWMEEQGNLRLFLMSNANIKWLKSLKLTSKDQYRVSRDVDGAFPAQCLRCMQMKTGSY